MLKVVLITGAGSGHGRTTTYLMVMEGVSVKLLTHAESELKKRGGLRPPDKVAQLAVFLASVHSVGISGEIGREGEYRDFGYGLSED